MPSAQPRRPPSDVIPALRPLLPKPDQLRRFRPSTAPRKKQRRKASGFQDRACYLFLRSCRLVRAKNRGIPLATCVWHGQASQGSASRRPWAARKIRPLRARTSRTRLYRRRRGVPITRPTIRGPGGWRGSISQENSTVKSGREAASLP